MSETFNSADGRPVVAADTAETIGEVKGFVVDPTATRIDAIHIAGRGRKAETLSWDSIAAFGADAVMGDHAAAAGRVEGEHETQAVKGNIKARGSRVLTTTGFVVGTVQDVLFDGATGLLTAIETDHGRIDADRLQSLGSYALVVAPE